MIKIIVAVASGMLFVSCKSQQSPTDAQSASVVGASNLSVDCVSSNDSTRNSSGRSRVLLSVKGKTVSLLRTVASSSGETDLSSTQTINSTINSVFDFNSLSQQSARLLLNPTSLKTIDNGKTSLRKLPYVMVEYSQGQLKVTEADAKLLFTQSNCKTKP